MKLREKEKSIELRHQGHSLKEISEVLNVAKSSVSLWVRSVKLSSTAKKRLLSRIQKGQYIAAENKKRRSKELNNSLDQQAKSELKNLTISKEAEKLIFAMIYLCEGAKSYRQGVNFSNSDPYLARLFIDLLTKIFNIDRSKIVTRLHLHEYHNSRKQQKFWADILNLSPGQFRKFYLKKNTKKRIREGYPGCITIRYYDSILARKILFLAKAYTNKGA